MDLSHHPITLYIPNLICYARIVLSFFSLLQSNRSSPCLLVSLWVIASVFDLIDGKIARKFNQCSNFGALLDITSDNILRGSVWLATVTASCGNVWNLILALFVISLEWFTMVATQLQSQKENLHWKSRQCASSAENGCTNADSIPLFVKLVFKNNFVNPLGFLAIYGSFSSGMWLYAYYHRDQFLWIPFFDAMMYFSFTGRFVAFFTEIWLCADFLNRVLDEDRATKLEKKSS